MTNKKIPHFCLFCTQVFNHPNPETRSKYGLQSQSLAYKTKRKKLTKPKTKELFGQNNIENFTVHIRKFCELFKLESKDAFTSELTEFLISSTLSSTCPLCQVCQSRMELIAKVMTTIQNLQVQLIRLKIAVESDLKLNDARSFKTPLTTCMKGTSDIDIYTKTRVLRKCLRKKLQLDLNAEVPVGHEDVPNVDVSSDDGKATDLITITILPSVLSVDGSEQTMVQFDGVDGVDIDNVNEDLEQLNLVKDEAEDEIKIETDVDFEIENTPAKLLNDVAACVNDNGDTITHKDVNETECTAIANDGINLEETSVTENVLIIERPEEVQVSLADHDYSLSLLSDIEPHPPNTKQAKKSKPPNVGKSAKLFRKYTDKPTDRRDITCAKKRKRPQAQVKAVKKSKGCGKVLKRTVVNLVKDQCVGQVEVLDQVRLDPHHTQPHKMLRLSLRDTSANAIDIEAEAQVEPLVLGNTPKGIHYYPNTKPIFADTNVDTRSQLTTDDLDDNVDNESLDLKTESDCVPDLDESNIEDFSKHGSRGPLPLKCTFVDPVKGECKRRAADQDRLDAHVNRVHKKLPSSKAFQCNLCSFTSDAFARLNLHRKVHAGIKDLTCEICGMSFRLEEYLVNHKRRMHGEPFPVHCDACKMGFNSPYGLKIHNYKNHGDGNFTHRCSVCGDGFYMKSHLKVHMLKHAKPTFQCDECPQKFKDRGRLKQHKIKHTGIRPFVCDVCDWSFFTKEKLRKHYSIHTQKRPFLCQECGFSCRLQELLTSHLKVHENNKSLAEKGIKKQPRLAKPRNRRIKTYENIFPPSVPTLISNTSAETENEQVQSEISKD